MAMGTTTNLGSRICAIAKAGQILISQATREAMGPGADLVAMQRMRFKGIPEPVTVYEVKGLHDTADGTAAAAQEMRRDGDDGI